MREFRKGFITMISIFMLAIFMSFISNFGVRAEEVDVEVVFSGPLPAAENKVDYSKSFTVKGKDGETAHCKIKKVNLNDFHDGVLWSDVDKRNIKDGELFVKNYFYYLNICVIPDDGYKINTNTSII